MAKNNGFGSSPAAADTEVPEAVGSDVEKSPDEAPAPAEAPAEAPALGQRVSLRAVFGGPMVNPLTEDCFTGEPSKPVTVDDWIKVQMEAGKIAIVE